MQHRALHVGEIHVSSSQADQRPDHGGMACARTPRAAGRYAAAGGRSAGLAAQFRRRQRPCRAVPAAGRDLGRQPPVGPCRRGRRGEGRFTHLWRGAFLGDRRYRQAVRAGATECAAHRQRGSPHQARRRRPRAPGTGVPAAGQRPDRAAGPVAGQLRRVAATGPRWPRAGPQRRAADPVCDHADTIGAGRRRPGLARRARHAV
ncbi:hypothetical protein D3C81_1323270 [compost metagenome]